MPALVKEIHDDIAKAKADLRKDAPELLAKLGVNTADEHAVFHAVLVYLLKAGGIMIDNAAEAILKGDI